MIITGCLFELSAQQPFFINYTIKTGLPSNTTYYTMQDSEGFVWVATDAGVCRYNGRTFVTFTPQDGLADNEIFQIHEDSQKRIWFLSFNGRISYYKDGAIYNSNTDTSLRSFDANDIYSCFLEDSKKQIWLGTQNKGFYTVSNGSVINYQHIPGTVFKIWEDNSRIMAFIGDAIYSFSISDPHDFEKVELDEIPISSSISKKILVDTTSNVIYVPFSMDGMFKVDYAKGSVQKVFNGMPILGIYQTLNHERWLYYDQAFQWNGGTDQPVLNMVCNPGGIAHMMQDNEGGYWIATLKSGIFYSSSLHVKQITVQDGLQENNIERLAFDKHGTIWAVHSGGKRSAINTASLAINTFPCLFTGGSYRVGQFQIISDTSWLMINPQGLHKMYGDRKKIYFPQIAITAFQKEKEALWVSGPSGIRKHKISDLDKPATQTNSTETNWIYTRRTFGLLAEPDKDRLLFGTQQGLALRRGEGEIEYISHLHPFLQHRIAEIKKDLTGNIWTVAEATGVVILDSELKVIGAIDKTFGLEDQCKRLIVDQQNKIWFITNHTLYTAELHNMKIKLKTVLYVAEEELNDVMVYNEQVWLASSKGLIVLPKIDSRIQQIPTRVTDIFINAKKIHLPQNNQIIASYSENNLRINFTGISFRSGNDYYRYKINTKDSAWSYTKLNELEFPSLPPGNYRFKIQSLNLDATWSSNSAEFWLHIQKPVWQQWWFVVLLVLPTITLSAFIIWRIYIANHRKIILKEKLQVSELKALTAQMNPHFIFNTLNTIQRFYMTQETLVANKLLSRFSTLIRRILDNTSRSFITIEDEVSFLKNYLEIEQTRFNQKFTYDVTVDASIDASVTEIPTMLIQPFVENAIIHGLTPLEHHGKIQISFIRENDFIKVSIDDNGVGRNTTRQQDHIPRGIALIKERLTILNTRKKAPLGLKIVDKQGAETGVRVELYL
jgi:ligand-binding sensor domain-containing protein